MKEAWSLESGNVSFGDITAACLTSSQKRVRVDYISLPSGAILHVNQWMALEVANHTQHSPASTLFSF